MLRFSGLYFSLDILAIFLVTPQVSSLALLLSLSIAIASVANAFCATLEPQKNTPFDTIIAIPSKHRFLLFVNTYYNNIYKDTFFALLLRIDHGFLCGTKVYASNGTTGTHFWILLYFSYCPHDTRYPKSKITLSVCGLSGVPESEGAGGVVKNPVAGGKNVFFSLGSFSLW